MVQSKQIKMTPADLLIPRVVVENLWPDCDFEVGEILSKFGSGENIFYATNAEDSRWMNVAEVEPFPYLMRPLKWTQLREIKDLPDYVKIKEWDGTDVPQAFISPKIHSNYVEHCTECPLYPDYFPATEAEFIEFTNSKK